LRFLISGRIFFKSPALKLSTVISEAFTL